MSDTEAPQSLTAPDPAGSSPADDVPAAVGITADGVARPSPSTSSSPAPRLTRRGRVRKWDRAPHPHDWRWYVGNVGKTLIAVGLLMFAFVGYQLYGTGIENAAAQNQLEDEFAAQLARFDAPTEATGDADVDAEEPTDVGGAGDFEEQDGVEDVSVDEEIVVDEPIGGDAPEPAPDTEPEPLPAEPAVDVVPVTQQNIPEFADGDALARLEIPAIGVNDIVVAGVDKTDLKKGPGHFPDTPLPGQLGNTAIAGHRTTFGQPFRNVDQLAVGDEIRVTTLNGAFVYTVTDQQIVSPADYQVVATSDPTKATITLVSCHPVFTARERIIIFGELDRAESSAIGAPVINYGREPEPDGAQELPDDDLVADDADVSVESAPVTTDAPVAAQVDEPIDDETVAPTTAVEVAPENDIDLLGSAEVNSDIADAFSESWFSDPAANSQVGLWGVALAAIAAAAYAISRRFRRDLVGLAVGLVPFTLALYFFFQNVNRLLPPNL